MGGEDEGCGMNDQPPEVLTIARPPQFWSAQFAERGIRMSARTLREKAIKAGLCYHIDKKVLISPRQIDELFVWSKSSWRSRSTKEAGSGGSPGPSKHSRVNREFMRAQEKLTRKLQTKSG
ncbi:MAG: hypothetical protein WA975_17810 [Mesorhizobium sp.]